MRDPAERLSRREFGRLTCAAAAGLSGLASDAVSAESPAETASLRIADFPRGVCIAPQYVAEELLRAEGFSDLQYVQSATYPERLHAVAAGKAHLIVEYAPTLVLRVDAGDPLVLLAGLHVGCFELIGSDRVRATRDLKGKTVSVRSLGSTEHVLISVMLAYVGLDPREVNWVFETPADSARLLAQGAVDAIMAFPPGAQDLRSRKIGHVLVNGILDRPWSQYFCCMVAANRDFVRRYPLATKRAVRALVKAADVCALEPERSARLLVDKKYTDKYDPALQAMREIPYGKWREYEPDDTVRFYALRLREVGMIRSSPHKILTQGTDWRFLNQLKKELKG